VQALDDAVAACLALVERVAEAAREGERTAAAPDGDAAVSRRSVVVDAELRVRDALAARPHDALEDLRSGRRGHHLARERLDRPAKLAELG